MALVSRAKLCALSVPLDRDRVHRARQFACVTRNKRDEMNFRGVAADKRTGSQRA
jgi:hypothetical protein